MLRAMQQPTAHVPLPDIAIDDAGTARSARFGDVYFSALGGVEETRHVFLRGNHLPQRWMGRAFTIGELGFGTGLNLLVTWQAHRQSGATHPLHYIAVERYPLTPDQLRDALRHYPELGPLADQLIAAYPLRLPGLHRVELPGLRLTLAFGEAETMLADTNARVDAWFLDGFAPARNEAMWSPAVLQQVARLSAGDATFATFTVAGAVRRGLAEVGFAVEKTKGYAHKREMLVGARHGTPSPATSTPQRVIVIGAGIAGSSVAHALARRGTQVTVLDAKGIAAGASGNPVAVLYPQLTKYYTPATAWHLTAYSYVLGLLKRLPGVTYAQPGMLKIGKDEADDEKLRSLRDSLQLDPAIAQWLERDDAAARLGQPLVRGGFWFAQGTWLEPASLCAALMAQDTIHFRQASVAAVEPGRVTLASGEILHADAIVLATAYDAQALLPHRLKMGRTSGQVTLLQQQQPLQAILCHKGYAIAHPRGLLIGATYERDEAPAQVSEAQHARNIAELRHALPALAGNPRILGGRAAERATTPHRLPYVGAVAPGLYVSVGHGSRGMLSAPLAGELLAAQLAGEAWPVSASLADLLRPQRLE